MNQSNRIRVAIDGPAGAGKSTVARMVAGRLGYVYLDTGSMYRAITSYVLRHGWRPDDEQRISESLDEIKLELIPAESGQQVWINGEDVTPVIRSPEVTANVSRVAQIPQVRKLLTNIQQSMSKDGGIVMDGRDIGTHVLPNAELKIFLTASVAERANRRYRELIAAGQTVSLHALEKDIAERDRVDAERALSPLRKAEDAIYLDCTELSAGEVVERIVQLAMSVMNRTDHV